MTKSFKDNYTDMAVRQTVTNESSGDAVVITPTAEPTAEPTKVEPVEVGEIKVGQSLPIHEEVVAPPPVRIELTEEIAEVLTEQREQAAMVLESVMKTNTKIANNVTKLVKNSVDTNDKLVEAILALTDKIGMLEAKLEAIENLEIPTPIVQVNSPNKKVQKQVHRDKKGIITHITESEVFDEDEGE